MNARQLTNFADGIRQRYLGRVPGRTGGTAVVQVDTGSVGTTTLAILGARGGVKGTIVLSEQTARDLANHLLLAREASRPDLRRRH